MVTRVRLMAGAVVCALAGFAAGVASAEPIAERGYAVGCDAEGSPMACYIAAAGFTLTVMEDGGTAPEVFDRLRQLDPVTAVQFTGDLGELGDSSATVVLSDLRMQADDLYEGNLRAMQGRWTPVGEETPFVIEIIGLDWLESVQDELAGAFQMVVGEACGDGILPGNGMVVALYRYGDDPADDACWRVEFVDEATLELRDFKGDQGLVSLTRVE
ncbi:MAG: hypothetical protein RLZZ563_1101 [Pseudomonadota bacterium]